MIVSVSFALNAPPILHLLLIGGVSQLLPVVILEVVVNIFLLCLLNILLLFRLPPLVDETAGLWLDMRMEYVLVPNELLQIRIHD